MTQRDAKKETESNTMSKKSVDLAGILKQSVVDGPGIRTVIFAQGCPHRCPGCHNEHTWEFGCGQKRTIQELVEVVRDNPLCKGVTFSGGEPFSQAGAFCELAKKLNVFGYEIASYTGYTFEELLNSADTEKFELLSNIDVLIDGCYIDEQRCLDIPFIGSSNQRILDVKKSLASQQAVQITQPRWFGKTP